MNRKETRRHLAALLLAATLLPTLGGCAAVAVGGAFVAGTMIVTDRRTSGTQIDDQAIELKAASRARELVGERGNVGITSFNRLVLITGQVATEADKLAVEQAVARVDNVRSTVNELAVTGISSLAARANDALLTSKVKASLVDSKDIFANAFKVVTERGVVYLMGRVTEAEAARGTDIARSVPGVQKVVRVFEVLTEVELEQLNKIVK
jgi:osmotically-inducible protein OsmY